MPSHVLGMAAGILLLALALVSVSEAGNVGVNFGRVADNLPPVGNVVELIKKHGISQVRIFDTEPTVLRSLAGTGVRVVVTLPNEQLLATAASTSYALSWVQRNVAAYLPDTAIQTVEVGNEVFVDPHNLTAALVPAMVNVHAALARLNLDSRIKVSTSVAFSALQSSYPSSSGAFRPELAESVMRPMLELIRRTGSYLLVNAYPFFAYMANSDVIPLEYALFRPNPGVVDAGSGLRYFSLFDAQIDAVFFAMRALGFGDVRVVVSETGWPSKGEENEAGAGAANAAAYNGNIVRRVLSGNSGTPMRPDADIDIYLFALFNENQKPGPASERNYGLFYPNEEKVYDIQFTLGGGGQVGFEEKRRKKAAAATPPPAPVAGKASKRTTGETWCVANGRVGKTRLQAALDYACGEGGADCGEIQPGAACYNPDTLEAHASFAFNSYYQKNGRAGGTCDFEGAAYVVSQAPKMGKCVLPSRA